MGSFVVQPLTITNPEKVSRLILVAAIMWWKKTYLKALTCKMTLKEVHRIINNKFTSQEAKMLTSYSSQCITADSSTKLACNLQDWHL